MLEVQKPLERYLHQTRQALVKTAAKELDALCKKDDFDDSKMVSSESMSGSLELCRCLLECIGSFGVFATHVSQASGVDCLTFWGQLSDIL